MTSASPVLEDRVRRDLRALADALPPAQPPSWLPQRAGPEPRIRRFAGVGIATAVAAAAVAIVVLLSPDKTQLEVRIETPPAQEGTPESTVAQDSPDSVDAAANGMVPGQAVVVESEVRIYGPEGAQTGAVDLAPLQYVQTARTDLAGGWVACADESYLTWFPAGGEPIVLEPTVETWRNVVCGNNAAQVVDAPEGPTVIYEAPAQDGSIRLHALVLATGDDRTLDVPITDGGNYNQGYYLSAASPGRVLLYGGTADTMQLYDMATGVRVRTADVRFDPGFVSDLVLAPDGNSLAALVEEGGRPGADTTIDLVVVDLATGAERHRESFSLSAEGAQLSYDGTTVAVGNSYDNPSSPPLTVIDLSTGARHTIDVQGLVL